jgi:hypothetical protein
LIQEQVHDHGREQGEQVHKPSAIIFGYGAKPRRNIFAFGASSRYI